MHSRALTPSWRWKQTMYRVWPGRSDGPAAIVSLVGAIWILLGVSLLLYWLSVPATVSIEWETATEVETAGFNVYRGPAPDGDFVLLNDQLVPSKGNAQTGASYRFVDDEVIPGQTYTYLLEEIERDAAANRYINELSSYRVPYRWWMVVTSVISILMGAAALVSGFKVMRNRRSSRIHGRESQADSSGV